MTWDELAAEIAKMTPSQRQFSVSIHDVETGDDVLVDEVNYEWQDGTERPLLLIKS